MRNHLSDLRGAGRIAIDATHGITDLVEAMHTRIAAVSAPVGGPVIGQATRSITALVYQGIRGVTRVVGGGIDVALGVLTPAVGHMESPPQREVLIAALNGVLGDYLAATGNPLALPMTLRRDGRPLPLARDGLAEAVQSAGPKVLVLVHGLSMSDLQWNREGHDHGVALAADLGYTPVYLHYNSGLHVSENGRAFGELLEALVASWPVPISEIAIVGHSMGGLVARSAHRQAVVAGHAWPHLVRSTVCLGTPHHGAPLERVGNWIDHLLAATPYTEPFSRLGRVRSAGITDLRHGCLLEEDWAGHDRFVRRSDPRTPVPLPDTVRCFAIGALLSGAGDDARGRAVGDGLVPLASALGQHREARFTLAFEETHQWIARDAGHLDLLSRRDVYARLRDWLGR